MSIDFQPADEEAADAHSVEAARMLLLQDRPRFWPPLSVVHAPASTSPPAAAASTGPSQASRPMIKKRWPYDMLLNESVEKAYITYKKGKA
jgi:hypothetical protein